MKVGKIMDMMIMTIGNKKNIILIVVLSLVISFGLQCLHGCNEEEMIRTYSGSPRFSILQEEYLMKTFVDTDTGVEYLYYNGAVTVLYNHDGSIKIAEGYFD